MRNPCLVLAGMVCLWITAAAQTEKPTLTIGDPAPPLKAIKFVKGPAVANLETGQVYVVEFWATWCGPCRATIPHLTEMAHQHKGKITFIGMDVFEKARDNEEFASKAESFVKEMGDQMDYTVGVDGTNAFMAKYWMEASGEGGIPCAFVVNKEGKIAWIGHPMDGLDKVLEQILAGKYDLAAAVAKRKQAKEAEQLEEAINEKVGELYQKGKKREALAEINKAIGQHPQLKDSFRMLRLNLLFDVDEAGAYKEIRQLAEGEFKNNTRGLLELAARIIRGTGNKPDYDLAITLAKQAGTTAEDDSDKVLSQAVLADTYQKKGDLKQAVATLTEAITFAKKTNAPEQFIGQLQNRLESFQKALAKPAGK
ncbi:MAG: redoxin family protein [Verrucomicrobiota bacterium]